MHLKQVEIFGDLLVAPDEHYRVFDVAARHRNPDTR